MSKEEEKMKGYVQEDLLEARRRTALHCRVRGWTQRGTYLEQDEPQQEANDAPTGFAIIWGALALSVAAVALILVLVLR